MSLEVEYAGLSAPDRGVEHNSTDDYVIGYWRCGLP